MKVKKIFSLEFAKVNVRKKKLNQNFNSFCLFQTTDLANDTHRERLVFHPIQYRNGWSAASGLFHIIKFENVIHQIDSKNGWLLLTASLRQNLG